MLVIRWLACGVPERTLYLSPRTVEWHLRKIFAKLGLNSRRQLRLSLREAERSVTTA